MVPKSIGLKEYFSMRDRSFAAMIAGRSVRYVTADEAPSLRGRRNLSIASADESGSGKLTSMRVLMGLEIACGGAFAFEGKDAARLPLRKRSPRQLGARLMVFQNPDQTVNPSKSAGAQVGRVIRKFGIERDQRAVEARGRRLPGPVRRPSGIAGGRPGHLAGGQEQPAGILRAFAGSPVMVVADEPVPACGVVVQAALIGLSSDLQRQYRTTMPCISHDAGLVRSRADRVPALYPGQTKHKEESREVFVPPCHPYGEMPLSRVSQTRGQLRRKRIILDGRVAGALDPPPGRPFHTRCPRKLDAICETVPPPDREVRAGHVTRSLIPLDELRAIEPVNRKAAQ